MIQQARRFYKRLARSVAAPSAAPAQVVEVLEDRRLLAAHADLGININDASASVMKKGVPLMKKLGVTSVRIWITVKDFNTHHLTDAMQRLIDYGHAGFDVMAIIHSQNGKVPNPSAVRGWFKWAINNKSLKGAVDRWEIGNEPDHKQYWRGSYSSYVQNFLKPAAEVLRPAGEPVVSAAPSWNADDVQKLIDVGILNYSDYVGYHPYSTKGLQAKRVAEIKAVVKGRKPIIASEWNVRGFEGNKSDWADAVNDNYPLIRDNFAMNYYFALVAKGGSLAGPGGIMTGSGNPTKFYYALSNAKGDKSHSLPSVPKPKPSTPAKPKPTKTETKAPAKPSKPAKPAKPTKTQAKPAKPAKPAAKPSKPAASNGNVASGLPTISRVGVFNADTNKPISGYESINDGDTLDLAKLGVRNIAIVATSSSATQSVLFNFNGEKSVDNTAWFSPFGDANSENVAGAPLEPGSYALTATPYSRNDAAGTRGRSDTIHFSVKNSAQTRRATALRPPVALQLLDAKTGNAIPGYENITDGGSIKLSMLPTRNIRIGVLTDGSADSVRIRGFGKSVIENNAPFRSQSWYVREGTFNVAATSYSDDDALGVVQGTLALRLKFY